MNKSPEQHPPFDWYDSAPFASATGPNSPFARAAALSEEEARRAALEVPDDAPEGTYTYALVKSRPEVRPEEVELTGVASVEVMILWGTNVLHVAHLTPPRDFYVGEEDRKGTECDYFIPAEKLGATRLALVKADAAGVQLVLPPGAGGTVTFADEPPRSLEQARQNAEPFPEASGAHLLTLPARAKARIELGSFVFQVATVNAGKPVPKGVAASKDYAAATYFGLSLLAHAGLIGTLAFFIPPLGVSSEAEISQDRIRILQTYLGITAEPEQDARDTEQTTEEASDDRPGGTGTRAKGSEGQMGKTTSRQTDRHYAVKGSKDNRDAHLARLVALREAAQFGMINLLVGGDANAPTAPWGEVTSSGYDDVSVQGNLWGATLGEAYGAGGLGLTDIGEGAGGRGEGIGLDTHGGLGWGAGMCLSGDPSTCRGIGVGIGSSTGRGQGPDHPTTAPKLRWGETVASGRLPREVIQRIVRQNYGRFRLCYEQGLTRNPNLQGRVAARFVIDRTGAVSSVSNGGSDLPDSTAVSCVLRAYYGLSFPEPQDGIVTVVYPIMFSPG